MGDVFGPRRTLLRIVIWWSTFMGLTGLAGLALPGTDLVPIGFFGLVFTQFLFGAGEAGAFPNITRALFNWFPSLERGRAQGFIWMSARLMGGLTPLVWLVLTEFFGLGWRQVLFIFAGHGGGVVPVVLPEVPRAARVGPELRRGRARPDRRRPRRRRPSPRRALENIVVQPQFVVPVPDVHGDEFQLVLPDVLPARLL